MTSSSNRHQKAAQNQRPAVWRLESQHFRITVKLEMAEHFHDVAAADCDAALQCGQLLGYAVRVGLLGVDAHPPALPALTIYACGLANVERANWSSFLVTSACIAGASTKAPMPTAAFRFAAAAQRLFACALSFSLPAMRLPSVYLSMVSVSSLSFAHVFPP